MSGIVSCLRIVLVLSLFFWGPLHAQEAGQDGPVIVAGTYVPLELEGPQAGRFARLVQRIGELAGFDIDLQVWPGRRARRQFSSGQADISFPDFIPPSMENAISSVPFSYIRRFLFTRPGAGAATLADMTGKSVSVVQGYTYRFVEDWSDRIEIVRATTERASYRLLTLGKVEGLVAVDLDILAMARAQGGRVPDYDPENPVEVFALGFSFHDSPYGRKLRDRFSQVLEQMHKSGELARILGERAPSGPIENGASSAN